jgi:DsbC/DsbD-like thiol-disulfide interchange protein
MMLRLACRHCTAIEQGSNSAMRVYPLAFAALLAVPAAALASSSQWFETEGVRIRLVTTGLPDAAGQFNGALEIALEPGWKTYWRDPGDAGVPPSIDIAPSSGIEAASFRFPPPVRIDDGATVWAGYKYPVALPVAFKATHGAAPVITADVFLGVCEAICVPVQARLEVDPGADPDNADDAVTVQAALDALPQPARPDFGVAPIRETTVPDGWEGKMMLEAMFPGEGPELFLSAPEGFLFGTPERLESGGRTYFSVAVLARPDEDPKDVTVPYTLVTSAGSVDGALPLPARDCCKPSP